MKRKKQRRRFSDEEVLRAVKRAREVGCSKAGQELDIHSSTIDNWVHGRSKEKVVARLSESQPPGESDQGGKNQRPFRVARSYTPSRSTSGDGCTNASIRVAFTRSIGYGRKI